VAAAAMFTSLKLDVKNAEAMAGEFMLAKVKAPIFVFNKIEPTAFASSSYINQGESLDLNVMVAAVDTTAIHKIRWGMDEDTLPERWTETQGKIALEGTEPGPHRVKGTIGVQERGSISWKPWSFAYNVGQPMGVIAQPKMRILYRDYDNILEGTASGFASDKVRLSSSDVSLSKKGNQWVARAGSGVRSAKISVIGTKDDGSSVNLGSFEYKVKPLPKPQMYFGSISNGANPTLANAKAQKNSKVSVRYDESVTLTDVKFRLVSGTVKADGLNRKGKINANGFLDEDAKKVIDQSRGKQVTMIMKYKNPSGNTYKTALVFEVR
jgi:hypothetical protein